MTTRRRGIGSGRLLALVLANLAILGTLVWATTERLHVTVVVSGDTVVGTVGSTSLAVDATGHPAGAVGLFLQGADPRATVLWSTAPEPARALEPQEIFSRLGAESSWTNLRVTDRLTGASLLAEPPRVTTASVRPWFGDWFGHPLGGLTTPVPGLALVGSASWTSYRVDVDLLRPRNAAGVLVLAPDGSTGLLFYFRPENRDVMWYEVRNGQWYGPLASAPYRAFAKDPVANVQDVLRLLLGGYPAALVVVGLTLTVAAVERLVRRGVRWIGRPWSDGGALSGLAPALGPAPARPGRVESRRAAPMVGRLPPNPDAGEQNPDERARVGVANRRGPGERLSRGVAVVARASGALVIAAPGRWPSALEERLRAVGRARRLPLADLAAGAIAVAGLAVTLVVADVLLEKIPHVQDSVAYLFQAKTFALGRLWVPTPPHPEFFAHEFIIMEPGGRWFSKYPPGWPMLLALGVRAGAPWVVDPVLGALSLFLLYRLGREAYRPRVGLLAAALGLASPFFIFLSGSMMAHTSGLFFTLLLAWAFRRAKCSPRPLWAALMMGVAFGFLFLIRPFTALLVVAPFAVAGLARVVQAPRDGLRRYPPAALAAAPFVLAFLAYDKVFTGSWFYPPQQLWWPFDQVGFGPDHGPWGFTPNDGLNNTSRNLSELLEHGFGWPAFLTLSLAAVPFLAGRARRWDWLFLAGFLAVVAGYACWWADGIMYGPRFYFEGFGFLVLLTARGGDVALDLAETGATWPERGVAGAVVTGPTLVGLVVTGLIAFNLAFYLPGQWTLYHGYNYISGKKLDAVRASGVHHALVFTNVGKWYEWWEYGMVFSANDPLLRSDIVYARDLGDAADRRLAADFPDRSTYRLDGTTLTPLDLRSEQLSSGG